MSHPETINRIAEPEDVPIPYIARTHRYYARLGFVTPYRYAHFRDVPFTRLRQPLAKSRIAIVTTAAPYQPGLGEQGSSAFVNAAAKFYRVYSLPTMTEPDLRISHIAYDRKHAVLTDMNCWFPLAALRRAAAAGKIGMVAPRFHGLPTNRSQRTTLEIDGPEIVRRCQEDRVDAVLLVPNCPICHQVVAITARLLEAQGIASVVMGAAKDIVEHCGVPRFLFSDFPLGNAAGRPHDRASQDMTLDLALQLLESAIAPRTTLQSPLSWSEDCSWKRDYCSTDNLTDADVARLREEFDDQKAVARRVRSAQALMPVD